MSPRPNTEPSTDLPVVDLSGIELLSGRKRRTVYSWTRPQRATADAPPFPDPVGWINNGNVYDRAAVLAWLRETGRIDSKGRPINPTE